MRNNPVISVIIATFNSAHLLKKTLYSVRQQTYPRSKIELLVIDGGSTDKTKMIAASFGCRILHNPKIVPAWAKFIGYKAAKGKYIMYLDSDEVILNNDSFVRKVSIFHKYPNVHALTGSGYINPSGYSFLNCYINEFGDPFSFFIYYLSKDHRFFIESMKRRYSTAEENKSTVIFDFSGSKTLPIFELVAMGSMADRTYLRKHFPEIDHRPELIPHLFYLLVSKNSQIAIVKDDPLVHYSSNSLGSYLKKIQSRVVNNIFTNAQEGYKGRDILSGRSNYKKYLFIPYAFSIIFPLIDALYLSVTRRNAGYLFHVPLTLYTAIIILYYWTARLFGKRYVVKSYGEIKAGTS